MNIDERLNLTPLHSCMSIKEARLLVKKFGVSPVTTEGITPLHYNHCPRVISFLISQGADVNVQRCDGMTPLHLQEKPSIVQTLLRNGANPNIQNNSGMTPLHCSLNIIKTRLLLNAGADCNVIDEDGDLPEDCYRKTCIKMIKIVKHCRQESTSKKLNPNKQASTAGVPPRSLDVHNS